MSCRFGLLWCCLDVVCCCFLGFCGSGFVLRWCFRYCDLCFLVMSRWFFALVCFVLVWCLWCCCWFMWVSGGLFLLLFVVLWWVRTFVVFRGVVGFCVVWVLGFAVLYGWGCAWCDGVGSCCCCCSCGVVGWVVLCRGAVAEAFLGVHDSVWSWIGCVM